MNLLAKVRKHELQIVCMQAFHETNIGCFNKRPFEDSLQQAVGCLFYYHSTLRYMS
jgi:hypothetical protein